MRQVSEGLDVLMAINESFVDESNRPLQNVRIRHTIVLDDPFPDPPQLQEHIPEASPPPVFAEARRTPRSLVHKANRGPPAYVGAP
jgi:peptidyl-prolyl cis-trans isomerase-like 4